LLYSGADITARDNDEMMPLMLAMQNGKMDVVSVMLDLGCDIHGEAKNDKSIIIWAIEKEYTSLVKVSDDHVLPTNLLLCMKFLLGSNRERSESCYAICG